MAMTRTVGERNLWGGHGSTNGAAHFWDLWVLQYYDSVQE